MRYSGACGGCQQLVSFETDAEGNGTIPQHGSHKKPCTWIGMAVVTETPEKRAERERLRLEEVLRQAERVNNRERLRQRVDTQRVLRHEAMMLGLLACSGALREPVDAPAARRGRRFPVPR